MLKNIKILLARVFVTLMASIPEIAIFCAFLVYPGAALAFAAGLYVIVAIIATSIIVEPESFHRNKWLPLPITMWTILLFIALLYIIFVMFPSKVYKTASQNLS